LARAGVRDLAEVWCHAPPKMIGARYLARLDRRPKGHPGADYVPELVALAARATPTGLAPVFNVDTTRPLDLTALTAWLKDCWGNGPVTV
jgi:glucokinase